MCIYFTIIIQIKSIEQPLRELLWAMQTQNTHIFFKCLKSNEFPTTRHFLKSAYQVDYFFLSYPI